MRRGSKAPGKAGKAGQRTTATRKRLILPKAVPGRRSAATGQQTKIARFVRERDDALERETATAEVLHVINRSPGDLEPVFNTILEKAHQLCGAAKGALVIFDGEVFRAVATRSVSQEYAAMLRAPQDNPPGSPPQLLLQGKRLVHVPDMGKLDFPIPRAAASIEGVRTVLFISLRKEDTLLGYITVYREEVRPFTDRDIALLENFAAQAVVAIENTRLLNELRQRTDDLSEALDQQTATSEVLRVISSSPGELEPVFQAMLENATRICGAKFGSMYLRKGDAFRIVAMHNAPPAFDEARRLQPLVRPGPGTGLYRVASTKQVVHIADIRAEQPYLEREPSSVTMVERAGARTLLVVPMLKDDELIGNINIYRQEVRPFTDKQIELVQNFAAQAVIAIENTRLLNELRERTDDLSESLEQQTATSQVLSVISSSPGE